MEILYNDSKGWFALRIDEGNDFARENSISVYECVSHMGRRERFEDFMVRSIDGEVKEWLG